MKTNEPCTHDRSWEQAYADMIYWAWEGEPPAWSVLSAVGFMVKALSLRPGATVLDLGCGLGHHAIELARRGCDVTALEWSAPFLAEARARAASASVPVKFIHGDMTQLAFCDQFDATVLWGNTFGLFSDADNVRALRGLARALKPGGLALIDTQNYTSLPSELKKDWRFSDGESDLLFLIEDTRDVPRDRFGFDVLAIDLASGERHRMPFSWRLYLLPELERLVAEAGLTLLGVYGDDPEVVDWKAWKRGQPFPYCEDGFTDNAAKRILLCRA